MSEITVATATRLYLHDPRGKLFRVLAWEGNPPDLLNIQDGDTNAVLRLLSRHPEYASYWRYIVVIS